MNRLLTSLGIVAVIVGGLFVLNGIFVLPVLISNLLNPGFLAIVIIALGFIRFNKIFGIVVGILGVLLILTIYEIIPVEIFPLWVYPWVLIAIGGRFLVIGLLSGENRG